MSVRVVTGTIAFIWEADDSMLVTMEPDDPADPHTFEVGGELRERLAGALDEGQRIEVDFRAVEYEVVDPDSGPSESLRAHVEDVRVTEP